MARLARIVLPHVPHHVTQRGNRRLPVFFTDQDRSLYLQLLAQSCGEAGVSCLGWCLMDNHVHLVLLPRDQDGLRAALAESHRRYTRHINFREGWRGHLFQSRFASYPMSGAHLLAAIRYVENNPVAAGMVDRAEDWEWSSARSHMAGRRVDDDPLTDITGLSRAVRNWRSMLKRGWNAAELDDEGEALADTIEARLRTGRPLGPQEWVADMEKQAGRPLAPQRRGPKLKSR